MRKNNLFACLLLSLLMLTTVWVINPNTVHASASNIALNKPVSVSSTYPERPDLAATMLVDGNFEPRWASKRATGSGSNTDSGQHGTVAQWLIIDLEEETTLTQINMHWENAYSTSFSIYGSLDGQDYFLIKDVSKSNNWN